MSFTMDPARCQGDGRRHKFLGRFAIPVQPCKMTNKGYTPSSSVRTLFMRPPIETKQNVQKSSVDRSLNDECLFGDSFCDNEILEGLNKIEAQYPAKKPTGPSKPLKSAGCSSFNLNSSVSHREARKSPKSYMSHTKDNPFHTAAKNETDKFPKGTTLKDQCEFALIGNETLKAIDAMDFDNSIDEIVSPGDENQVAKPLAIVITPLRNRSKRKVSSNSKVSNIRRSQRLKVKRVIAKTNGDPVYNVEHPERNEKSREKFNKFEKTILNNQQSLESPSTESSFVNGNSLNEFLFDKTPEELSAKPVGKLKPNGPVRSEKDLCIFQSLVKTSPPIQNNCVSSKQSVSEIRENETKNCENRKDNCTLLETNGTFPQALETNSSSLKGRSDSKTPNLKKMIVGDNSKDLEFSISEQSVVCRNDSHDKELKRAGSLLEAAGHDKVSCTEQSQAQSELKAENNASSAKILAVECSTGAKNDTRFHTPVTSGRIKKPTKLGLRDTGDLDKVASKSKVQSETFRKAGVISAQESNKDVDVHLEKRDSDLPCQFTEHTSPTENIEGPGINAGDLTKDLQRKSVLNASANISKGEHSFLSTQAKMDLASWGLPEPVLQRYIQNGIKTMFPWQAECLSLPDVLDGKNLVYSAPTSAGKTLVSELLLLKRVLETGRKGLYILPFVSVAREKMYYLQKMFSPAGVRVEGFMGSHGPPGGLKVTDVAICTIEKANNLVNRLLEEKRFSELGIVVVDEIHMLGDPHRGYLLELLLTKTMFVCQTAHAVQEEGNSGVQIVGMSATLPNLDLLALWLNSQLYSTDYRPVPLAERVKIGKTVFDCQFGKFRDLDPMLTVKGDSDHLIQLCLETVLEGFSVLVFCPTKVWCEKLAEGVAKEFFCIGKLDSQYPSHISAKLRESLNSTGITKVMEALHKCPVGLDKVLGRSISFGVAYHHAGLTFDERDIVEGGFRNGSVRVLVATSTLSSGVNLPARRVIIRSPVFGGSILDTLTYKQMIGRAGRKGVDTEGESILICREGEKQKAQTLLASTLPPITSCLQQDSSLTSSMKRAVLEVIVSGVAAGPSEVARYCSCTLLAASLRSAVSESQQDAQNSILSCVQFLEENEFIRLQETESGMKYIGTQLGCAVLASGLSPDEGLLVFSELHRARQCFVLENELHIIYQVTPVYVSSAWPNMDWLTFLSIWESLSDDMKRVADLVGVEESFIVRAMKGTINRKVRRQAKLLAVHQRFYTALALHELVQEVPLNVVAQKYSATRGMLQSLQQSAATFAGMVTVFCNRLGWHNLELLVSQFHDRLHFGIQRELCDLVRLSSVNGQRARYLYNAGLETVSKLAHSSKEDVENILHAATPFQSNKMDEKDSKSGGTIWLSSNRPLTEAQVAALIVEEARQLVQKELGLSSIDWTQRQKVITTPNRCPRPRKGSSSSKRRSSSARRKYSPPNPILQAESAAGANVISPALLDRTVASAMTPLHRKRSRSSPQTITSINKKSRSMMSVTEVEKVVKQNAPEAKQSTQLALELKEAVTRTDCSGIHASEGGRENDHDIKSGGATKEVFNGSQRNPNQLLPNEEAIFQKPHTNGFSNVEKADVEYIFQGHENVLHEVNSDSKELEFRPNEKERKDAKGRPKNRHWKENQSEQINRKDSQKENARPPDKNDVHAAIQHCEVDRSLNNQVKDSNNTPAKITARGILFGRNNSKNDTEFSGTDVRPASFYVPESQDDKIEVFSRKRKAKAKKNIQISECEQSSNNNIILVNQDKKDLPDTADDQELIENGNNQNNNSLTSTNQRSHITRKIHGKKRMRSDELSNTEDPEEHNSQKTLKKAKIMINSSSTPITDTDERMLRATSLQGHNQLSVVNYNKGLSFEGTERCNTHDKENIDSAVEEKRDRESDLFKDSSFEKVGEGSCKPDCIDFLSESQKEAFLMTMNSQDFDSESCRFDLPKDEEQCDESCFDIACSKRSYEALLDSEPRKRSQQLRSTDVIEGGSSATEMINQKHVEDQKKVDPCLLPKYHACEEDLGWELDLSPLEDVGHGDKVNGREILSSDGSDTEITEGQGSPSEKNDPTKPRKRLPSGDMDIEGLIPLELGQSICDLQDPECEKINAGNDSLSDSFFERAFDTYLNTSSSNIFDVEDRSPSEGEKCRTKDDDKAENPVETETAKLLQVEDNVEVTSRKNRLSDDLFSTSILVSQSDQCLQTTTSGIPKQNNHQPKGKLPAVDSKKRSLIYETKSKPGPSTSTTITDDQCASSDISDITSNSFCIIDVVGDAQLFDCFVKEWKEQKRFSLSLACEKPTSHHKKGGIGWRITGHSRNPRGSQRQEVAGLVVENSSLFIVGVAVCWGGHDAYYINFKTTQEEAISCSFPTPPICEKVPYEKRIAMVKEAFADVQNKSSIVCTWDVKTFVKLIVAAGVELWTPNFEDPKIASWMLDPGAKEQNIHNLVVNYKMDCLPLLESLGSSWGLSSLGVNTDNPGSCRVRAATECVVVYHLTAALKLQLKEVNMLRSFVNVEMPSAVVLAYLELSGMGFSNRECEVQKAAMQEKMASLEQEAYSMVGHPFSLTSPEETSQVLYHELHLPTPPGQGTTSRGRRGRGGQGSRMSGPTNKETLEKLQRLHPLPSVILQWRKINSSLTKVVFPLQHERVFNKYLGMDRIHPRIHTHTATGRVTMHDPNLQTVPRDFNIQKEIKGTSDGNCGSWKQQQALSNSRIMMQLAPLLTQEFEDHTISLRHALVAHPENILLAADYSQLELRLLAHLASDTKLLHLLNSGEDVFKMIAAQIHFTDVSEVTSEQRQQAKQICYGMIYGMGARALGEQLNVDENEALTFMDKFKSRFPGVQEFMQKTVESCRERGYVETLMGRRRYLPNICSANSFARSQSERQAVNTAIQGSAADLVKIAMVEIANALRTTFPSTPSFLTQPRTPRDKFSGAYLVLQLHDELIYEVANEDVIQVAQLVQKYMEGVHQLAVCLPVKIKVGPSWASMQTLNL